MIPCSSLREQVQSQDADVGRNPLKKSHPPPFWRVAKNIGKKAQTE